MPLNYADNWLYSNFPGYAGMSHKVFMLDNYEASAGHFPLVWKEQMDPEKSLGNFASSHTPCINLDAFKSKTGYDVSAILVMGTIPTTDSCSVKISGLLQEKFTLQAQDQQSGVALYFRK